MTPSAKHQGRCIAISKSTGERCKRRAVVKDYCKQHSPNGGGKLGKGLAIGVAATTIVKNIIEILTGIEVLLANGDYQQLIEKNQELQNNVEALNASEGLSRRERALINQRLKLARVALKRGQRPKPLKVKVRPVKKTKVAKKTTRRRWS